MLPSKSLKRNFLYNFALNIINILFPLITSPYVSRVLGPVNLGKYNFSMSFSSWFLVFATFGTTTYGIREVAKVREGKKDLDKIFTEIFLINLIATSITFLVYIMIIFLSSKTNSEILLFLISAISIIMNLFCIDWFYMGMEQFGVITLRSIALKLISLFFIFLFVKERNDYSIYALISVLVFGITNIFNLFYSKKFVSFTFKNLNLKRHLKYLSIFFYSSVVVSIYTQFDQVFLGFFSTNKNLAFYVRAKQIYSIALSITLSISVVLLPKFTYLAQNDFEEYKGLLKKSINYIYIISVPSVICLIVLSKDLMWFFGGKEFESAYISLIIVSILVFTVSLGTWQYDQLFIPLGREKVGLKVQIFMAVVSGISNIICVPNFGYIGASISLVIAEISGTIYAVYYAKSKIKEVKIKYLTKSLYKYIFSSIVTGVAIFSFRLFNYGSITNILFGVFGGSLIYIWILTVLKDSLSKEISKTLLKKINVRLLK